MVSTDFDLFFAQKRSLRYMYIAKLGIKNTYAVPFLKKIVLYIWLRDLAQPTHNRVLAAFFLLRVLTGKKPFISRFGCFQTFKKKNYDLIVEVTLVKEAIYTFLSLFSISILPELNILDLTTNLIVSKKFSIYFFSVRDLSFLRVVETHSVFFRWADHLNIKFFFSSGDEFLLRKYFQNLKFLKF